MTVRNATTRCLLLKYVSKSCLGESVGIVFAVFITLEAFYCHFVSLESKYCTVVHKPGDHFSTVCSFYCLTFFVTCGPKVSLNSSLCRNQHSFSRIGCIIFSKLYSREQKLFREDKRFEISDLVYQHFIILVHRLSLGNCSLLTHKDFVL